jgi:hypothetical protein
LKSNDDNGQHHIINQTLQKHSIGESLSFESKSDPEEKKESSSLGSIEGLSENKYDKPFLNSLKSTIINQNSLDEFLVSEKRGPINIPYVNSTNKNHTVLQNDI